MPVALTAADVDGMKVAEMREALTERGLPAKGVKKELAARLLEAIAAGDTAAGEEPAAAEEEAPAATEEEAPAAEEPAAAPVEESDPAPEEVPAPAEEPAPVEEPAPAAEEAAPVAEEAVSEPGAEAIEQDAVADEPAAAPAADEAGETVVAETEPAPAPEPSDTPSAEAPALASGEEPPADPAPDPAPAPTPTPAPSRPPANLDALRAEVGGLRRQHQELNGLVQQWYHAVQQLQARAPPPHMQGGYPPHAGYQAPYAAHGYPPAAGGYAGYHGGGGGYPAAAAAPQPQPTSAWSEHYTPEGHMYYYNMQTGASSWEKPQDYQPKRGGGGGGGGGPGKQKGPPGANLFVVRKMRKGEYDDFTDDQLREAFERFGPLVRAEITMDKDTGISKGYGFVSYAAAESADAALAAMNGAMIGGRQIRIEKTSEDGG
uniref:Uncharacterized protein n=1 Tax=Haptolina ericina TaxID=156174 RepID=A0A7S3AZ34_9EUKA|mmetsp:Transcript_43402/g.98045  ORF Transcript_43402/g.98045 Transcript_43402/m.98045 type:complete len:432 (+) Transcript_43402:32-1327(+)